MLSLLKPSVINSGILVSHLSLLGGLVNDSCSSFLKSTLSMRIISIFCCLMRMQSEWPRLSKYYPIPPLSLEPRFIITQDSELVLSFNFCVLLVV